MTHYCASVHRGSVEEGCLVVTGQDVLWQSSNVADPTQHSSTVALSDL